MGGYQMSNESSDAFKIRRAPNGKFSVWGNGEAISRAPPGWRATGRAIKIGKKFLRRVHSLTINSAEG
jgi:hypothetical protein